LLIVKFILIEVGKLTIIGAANMFLLPVHLVMFGWKSFRRKKRKMETEEEQMNDKKLKLIKKVNKMGFFTGSTNVAIIGREAQLGYGKIIKMDYDPEYYKPYDVNPSHLVLHVQFPGDSTVWFVNIDKLRK
jgi:hypothetical protein